MDLTRALKEGVVRLRDAIHEFARHKGWSPNNYRIFMYVNYEWNTFSIELLAHEYQGFPTWGRDKQYEAMDQVLDFMQKSLADRPDLFNAMRLTMTGLDGYGWSPSYDPGPSLVSVPDNFLNPDATNFRGDFRREHGIQP